MMRSVGLTRRSQRLVGCIHETGALLAGTTRVATETRNYGDGNYRLRRPIVPSHQSQSLHLAAIAVVNSSRRRGDSGVGRSALAWGARLQDSFAAWRRDSACESLGARRSIWTPRGWSSNGSAGGKGKGSSEAGDSGDGGFPEAGAEGDSWTPPPDAWKPDEAPVDPQDSMSAFQPGEGFAESAADIAGEAAESAAEIAGEAVAAAPDAAAATLHSAADLGLYPSHIFMQLIEFIQATAGVPYWEAIVITSIAAKVAMLPVVTTFQGMTKRMNVAKPEITALQAKMQDIKDRVNANPEAKAAAMQEMSAVSHEMMAVLRTHRISYPKMIACIFGQAPVFISIFLATQQMGGYFPGYATGGLDWMLNLGAPDPTYTLPILTCATMMLLLEFGTDSPPPQVDSKSQVNMKQVFRAMSIVFIPVAFTMPAGVLVYWTTTNIFGMFQRLLLESRAVQQYLGWPMPEDMPAAQPPEEPKEADFASKEDLERWGGGGGEETAGQTARGASDAAERAREAVAKASKVRHEQLKREHEERAGSEPPSGKGGSGDDGSTGDRRQY